MRGSRIPLIFSLIFLVIFLVPIFYLVYGSMFFQIGGATLTSETFVEVMTSPKTGLLLVNTLIFAIGGGLLAVSLATTYAWLVVRTDVPGKRLLQLLPILPLTMPFIVKAFAWIFLFSPHNGLVNLLLEQALGVKSILNIYSMPGMIFAIGTGGLPLSYLTIEPAVKALNPALEEASRVAGNGILKTLWRISLPVLMPAILSAFLLLLIIGLGNFDYPFMLGNPAGIDTLATEVYFAIYEIQPAQYGVASIISIIYLALAVCTVSVYIYATRKTFKFVVVTGKAARESVHSLRKWRYVALAICFTILLLAFLLPFGTLVVMSLTSFLSAVGGEVQFSFTLDNYVTALNLPLFYNALRNSLSLGVAAGAIGTGVAAVLSYAALKSKVRGARFVEFISSIPLAFPGIVYGLALFWTFLLLPGVSTAIYGTIWPLVIALVFLYLPYCTRMVSASLIQIADELEESSRVSGATWGRTFYKIVLPLMRRGLLNSFLYAFINSLRELGAVVLLVTAQSVVLTTLLLNLLSQHAFALNTVAAASVLLSVLIMVALAVQAYVRRAPGTAVKKPSKV